MKTKGNGWTESDITRATAMWANGASYVEIGEDVGRSRNAVAGFIDRHRDRFPARETLLPGSRETVATRLKRVAPLWQAGLAAADISDRTGLAPHQIYNLARNHPDRLPPRGQGPAPIQRARAAVTRAAGTPSATEPAKQAARLDPPAKADAFKPLSITRPALLWESCGCTWPVHVDGSDPMRNATLFVCDAAPANKKRTPDGRVIPAPYCTTHMAMAAGETEWRAKREAMDARRAA
ncbi:hypothetical protein VQ042_18020 [Aurantimonas sp. A2-1-M11]|uniref:hypothetical protein n=1 Tax=Aurantimonas sp. A2-1-M11 TaxID=3113712 RepID=UPI002F958ECB